MGILAEERRQRFHVDAPAAVPVLADRLVLRDAIANVVDNALKYGPTDSAIDVAVERDGNQAVLTIGDQAPGRPHSETVDV